MKRWLVIAGLLVAMGQTGFTAESEPGERRQNDYLWLQLNLYSMHNTANAFGDTYNNNYLELEGGGRSGILDFYYFFDVNEIFGWGSHKKEAGHFFTKIKPRLSLDGITGRDLALGPVSEWYLAAQYKGFNGGEYYYAGLGTDLEIPGVDVLSVNFWPQFLRDEQGADFAYTGLQVSLNWYTVLFRLPRDATITYQGWLDWGFLNRRAQKAVNGTADEFQMFNGFFLNWGHYSVSASVKFHYHFTYRNSLNSDATTWFLGAHYRL
jgi:nucleoside-specific channel-forming protein